MANKRQSQSRSRSRSGPKPVVDEKNMTVKVGSKKYPLKTMKNGSRYYVDPNNFNRPRIVAGSSPEYMKNIQKKSSKVRSRRSKRRSNVERKKSLEKRNTSALRAFFQHYSKARYPTERGRKIAMTRDLRDDNQKQTRSLSKYRKSPHKYDMTGVDMGRFHTIRAAETASHK